MPPSKLKINAQILQCELKKVLDQIRGRRNIFGYKSTLANQLYLIYCASGGIYFSDKIHRYVKYAWYTFIGAGLLILNVNNALVLLQCRFTCDLASIASGSIFTFGCDAFIFGSVLMWRRFRAEIESLFESIDEIIIYRAGIDNLPSEDFLNLRKTFVFSTLPYFLGVTMCSLAGVLDVTLFFEREKLRNPMYYVWAVPDGHSCDHAISYFLVNFLMLTVNYGLSSSYAFSLTLLLSWTKVCWFEASCIGDDLNLQTRNLNAYVEKTMAPTKAWNRAFKGSVRRTVDRFQKLVKSINHTKRILQVIITLLIPIAFFLIVALIVVLSTEMLFVLKLRFVAFVIFAVWEVLKYYWIGDTFDESMSEIQSAIYSTPWYWSVDVRKDVYIFLCQVRYWKNLTIFGVHPLLLANYSRFLHAVYTSTNFLLRVAKK